MDAEKQAAQAKLVNRLMAACMTGSSLTAIEVLGALEVAKQQIIMRMFSTMPEAPPQTVEQESKIVNLNGAPASVN